jgi:hypothetical protein
MMLTITIPTLMQKVQRAPNTKSLHIAAYYATICVWKAVGAQMALPEQRSVLKATSRRNPTPHRSTSFAPQQAECSLLPICTLRGWEFLVPKDTRSENSRDFPTYSHWFL